VNEVYYVAPGRACPVAPEDGTGVAPEDGTGVAPGDRTGVDPACPVKLFFYLTGVKKSARRALNLF